MKKLVLLFALAGTLGVSAADTGDSYIYWMVPKDASGQGGHYGGEISALTGTYTAKVVAFSGSEWSESGGKYLNLFSSSADNGFASRETVKVMMGANNVPYFASIAGASGSGWTYFVELWNDGVNGGEGQLVARSSAGLCYSQENIVALSGLSAPGMAAWAPQTFVPVPEPNSALLLLIGCATLALRRRKQVVA